MTLFIKKKECCLNHSIPNQRIQCAKSTRMKNHNNTKTQAQQRSKERKRKKCVYPFKSIEHSHI